MSSTAQTADDPDLTDVAGVGTQTAENLRDKFGSDEVALDAVQSIPAWVNANIDGIGDTNLSLLREYAEAHGHNDQTDRKLTSLRGSKFKGRYDDRYYACGQRDDNLCLFYTGYYQGKEYRTSFSGRQNLRDKRVNRLAWTFYSFTERDHVVVEYERRGEKQYIADVIDAHDWKTLTDTACVFYQRGRNYELDHYPDTTSGWQQKSGSTGSVSDLTKLTLVGITRNRIALYRKGNTIFRYVKEPGEENVLRRLYGYTHFGTDRDYELGEFGTMESFVKKLADNGEWKTYGSTTYVADDYQQHL